MNVRERTGTSKSLIKCIHNIKEGNPLGDHLILQNQHMLTNLYTFIHTDTQKDRISRGKVQLGHVIQEVASTSSESHTRRSISGRHTPEVLPGYSFDQISTFYATVHNTGNAERMTLMYYLSGVEVSNCEGNYRIRDRFLITKVFRKIFV